MMGLSVNVGATGLVGWSILKRTADRQQQLVNKDPFVSRQVSAAQSRLPDIQSADELVADYQLLKFTLTAYGLEKDLPNKAFIKKVLKSDVSDKRSFVNRLSDKRYRKLASEVKIKQSSQPGIDESTVEKMVGSYKRQMFHEAVGQSNQDYRLALNAIKEIGEMAKRDSSDATLWYEVISTPPLKEVFTKALGLNSSVLAKMPVDKQKDLLIDSATRSFGTSSVKDFSDEAKQEKLIRNFIVRGQLDATNFSSNKYSVALSLLSSSNL